MIIRKLQPTTLITAFVICAALHLNATAQPDDTARKWPNPPTATTQEFLEEVERNLPIGDFSDGSMITDHSNETLVAHLPEELKNPVFAAFGVSQPRPKGAHPVVFGWVSSREHEAGLFQLAKDVYQLKGDIGRATFIRGERGWVILDVGAEVEFATAAWKFAREHLPGGAEVPVTAVVYSHSHLDHYGGVKGYVAEIDVEKGNVEIIAPFGFMNEVASENILAGTAMERRSDYHFGRLQAGGFLELGESGTSSLIPPTMELPHGPGAVTIREIDGVTIHFKDASNAEAPAATMMYLPKYKMIFNSELMWPGQHNLYTLRGAKVRDALGWSKRINEVIHSWGKEAEIMTGPHGPNFSGNEKILEYMRAQRDNYGFIHNQAVRLLNQGVKLQDMGQTVEEIVPRSLSQLWHTHGYHGTYSHNSRAVFNRYLGFYDGNPANLNPLQIKPESIKFVEYMGGAGKVVERARTDFEAGNYRFVATVLNKVVTADPSNEEASRLLADTYEQLAYQSKGPQWANAYRSAALELRMGKVLSHRKRKAQLIDVITVQQMLDAMAARLVGPRADGKRFRLNFVLPDIGETYLTELSHSNLSSIKVAAIEDADATVTARRTDFPRLLSGVTTTDQLIKDGVISVEGDLSTVDTLLGLLQPNDPRFQLVPVPENP